MYIEFQKVRWKNFLATGNYFNEVILNSHPTTLFAGESGSGKSSFLDAISFALFNTPFRKINKPSVINSINKKECVVEIEFKVGTKQYKVVRGYRPVTFEIYCNGKLVNQDSHNRDYQKYLEQQILGFNYPVFTQIVGLGASNFVPFMKLTPRARRLVIEELLDMEIFSTMGSVLKDKISETKSRMYEVTSGINITEEKKNLHEQHLQNLSKDSKALINENNKKILAIVDNIRTTVKQIRLAEEELVKTEATLVDSDEIFQEMTKYTTLLNQLTSNQKKLDKKLKFFEDNDTCPTCNQDIQPDFKEKETNQKKKTLVEIETGIKKVTRHTQQLSKHKAANDLVKRRVGEIKERIFRLKTTRKTNLNQINQTKKENDQLNVSQTDRIEAEKATIQQLEQDIIDFQKEEKELKDIRHVQDLALNILKDSGVKSRIIKEYLPIINKHINKYLGAMNFFISFFIDENFDERIQSRNRDTFSYGNFSDGERQRIDLALLFTWRAVAQIKNSVNTNLLVLDELMDSALDQNTTENVIDLINSDTFKKLNIFVVSHKNTIRDKFSNVLDFKVVNNFSRIL